LNKAEIAIREYSDVISEQVVTFPLCALGVGFELTDR
jgi:hypothetical protein